jgi:hypothetical protein
MSILNGALNNPQAVFGLQSLSGISCATASRCQAVGRSFSSWGAVVTVTDGTAGTAVVAQHTLALVGIACVVGRCEAVGTDRFPGHGLVATVDPISTARDATFNYPNWDGQTNVNPFVPFSWSTVPQAQAYYVIVGTKQYGSDLMSSGALGPTRSSISMPDMPIGPTIYATLLVEADNAWLVHDSISFTTVLGKAVFTYPRDGQTGVDQTEPFTWSEFPEVLGLSFPQAQGYYLTVGTTRFGTDLISVQLGALTSSFTNKTVLPSGRTLYATLLTMVAGQWSRFQSITFSVAPPPAPSPAQFTYPVDGQTKVDTVYAAGFRWTVPFGAQGFYLIVGTTRYGSDLVNTGVMPPSQYLLPMPGLPNGRALYATLYTKANGSWNYFQAITFTVAPGVATFTYPTNGQIIVDPTKHIAWTSIVGAQGYYLALGTHQNGSDLINSGVIPADQISWIMPTLPSGPPLYATLFTEVNGTWTRFQAITFHR